MLKTSSKLLLSEQAKEGGEEKRNEEVGENKILMII